MAGYRSIEVYLRILTGHRRDNAVESPMFPWMLWLVLSPRRCIAFITLLCNFCLMMGSYGTGPPMWPFCILWLPLKRVGLHTSHVIMGERANKTAATNKTIQQFKQFIIRIRFANQVSVFNCLIFTSPQWLKFILSLSLHDVYSVLCGIRHLSPYFWGITSPSFVPYRSIRPRQRSHESWTPPSIWNVNRPFDIAMPLNDPSNSCPISNPPLTTTISNPPLTTTRTPANCNFQCVGISSIHTTCH